MRVSLSAEMRDALQWGCLALFQQIPPPSVAFCLSCFLISDTDYRLPHHRKRMRVLLLWSGGWSEQEKK
jgi:hypothetical protein